MKSARKTSTTHVEGELLDVEEASRLLGVHRNTLYRLIQNDNLPALRLTRGGRWRFPRQDLLDWIEARQARRVA
ncbi:MAG: helix-turn-helix domain-containing protein [Phycisphaerae bacterium]|nr:helix-turn-helix domain-containing protein [Phycisphaerae bacterium]